MTTEASSVGLLGLERLKEDADGNQRSSARISNGGIEDLVERDYITVSQPTGSIKRADSEADHCRGAIIASSRSRRDRAECDFGCIALGELYAAQFFAAGMGRTRTVVFVNSIGASPSVVVVDNIDWRRGLLVPIVAVVATR